MGHVTVVCTGTRVAENLGRGPESWDLQGVKALVCYLIHPAKVSAAAAALSGAQRSEYVLFRLPSYVKVYTIEFLNKYV